MMNNHFTLYLRPGFVANEEAGENLSETMLSEHVYLLL